MMEALDAGAEDFQDNGDHYEIITAPEDFEAVKKAIDAKNIPTESADVTMIPQTYVHLTDPEAIGQLNRILDLLDESDDVQDVYTNWDEEEA